MHISTISFAMQKQRENDDKEKESERESPYVKPYVKFKWHKQIRFV